MLVETRREGGWGSLPPELLSRVLQKVQEGATQRGEGRRAVALAGVCRAWRQCVQQELQRRPPCLHTFPASVQQPPPCGYHHRCLLKKSGKAFRLVQVESGCEYFLLGARMTSTYGCSYFTIGTNPGVLWTQGDNGGVIVTSNFWRTVFTLQDDSCASQANTNSRSKSILSLKYEQVVADEGHYFRKMRCKKLWLAPSVKGDCGRWPSWLTMLKWNHLLNFINPVIDHSSKLLNKSAAVSSGGGTNTVKNLNNSSLNEKMTLYSLRSKDPKWDRREQCWMLDFFGTRPSTKKRNGSVRAPPPSDSILASHHNFQLVSSDECDDGRVILQLGKLCKRFYVLDFCAPLSALEAFAISLSTFASWGFDPVSMV